jgi:hypothetical protein
VFGQPTDACLNKENSSDLAGWCISLSSVISTSDIGAPGVLLDVIEQNHGDKVFAPKIEFVRRLPSGRALILQTHLRRGHGTYLGYEFAEALKKLLACISDFFGSYSDKLHAM